MKRFDIKSDALTGEIYYDVYLRGHDVLSNPILNKGRSFTEQERRELGLLGLLPAGVSSIEEQLERCMENYRRKTDDIEKYIYLTELLNRNETLFYRLVMEHLDEMVPIIYTPVVGRACLQTSRILRRPRGLYIDPSNIGHIDEILQSVYLPKVQLIVVTDGERILGLGDLGSDGMGIPIGKLGLYVAAGGLHPACCLPVCIDVGTNNPRLLNDPLYSGLRQPRLTGDAYFELLEKFVLGVKRNFPGCLIQWEDFAKDKAFTLLERYRHRVPSFDDDIQGTGATACAALLTAVRIQKRRMSDQRVAIVGLGQAGTGVAMTIAAVMKEEGLSDEEVRERIFGIDAAGLVMEDDAHLESYQQPFAQRRARVEGWSLDKPGFIGLRDVVRNAKPTVLVGVTAQAGLFDAEILEVMGRNAERPVIFALSNPTSCCECQPVDAMKATGGRALMATGSPFAPVEHDGRSIAIAQCNNLYIFPGVGLGALVAETPTVTDRMFVKAAQALSAMVNEEEMAQGLLLPSLQNVRKASFEVALAVAKEARDAGLGRLLDDAALARLVAGAQWKADYTTCRGGKN